MHLCKVCVICLGQCIFLAYIIDVFMMSRDRSEFLNIKCNRITSKIRLDITNNYSVCTKRFGALHKFFQLQLVFLKRPLTL